MARIEWTAGSIAGRELKCVFEDAKSSVHVKVESSFHVKQVHGREIYALEPGDFKRYEALGVADGIYVRPDLVPKLDRPLVIKTADCLPLLMHDESALVAIHAGWRGLQQGVHRRPFEDGMLKASSTKVYVGPSLSGDNFEVGPDMWEQFPESTRQNARYFRAGVPGRKLFGAWELLEDELKNLGVQEIRMSGVNTLSDSSFASYRRATHAGTELDERNYSWIGFKGPRLA